MITLYRNLLDLIIRNGETLTNDLRYQIRKSGSGGFWNFLLETFLLFVVRIASLTGIFIIVSLAIIFFPLHAVKCAFAKYANPFKPMEKTDV